MAEGKYGQRFNKPDLQRNALFAEMEYLHGKRPKPPKKGERSQTRWKNLSENYKKSRTSVKTQCGEAARSVKRYRFSDQFNFLDTDFSERETKRNIDLSAGDDCESEYDEEHDSPNKAEQPQPEQDENNTGTGNIGDKIGSTAFSPPGRYCRKRQLQDEPEVSSILMKYIIEKNSTQGSTAINQATELTKNPVDAFLFGISPMLKSLSAYYLSLAKSEIFAAAHKYEIMMLTKQSNTTTTTTATSGEGAMPSIEALPDNGSAEPLSCSSRSTNNNNEDNLQIFWRSFGRNSS